MEVLAEAIASAIFINLLVCLELLYGGSASDSKTFYGNAKRSGMGWNTWFFYFAGEISACTNLLKIICQYPEDGIKSYNAHTAMEQ